MKIKGRVWLYMLVIGIGIWLIHSFFYFSIEGYSENTRFVIHIFRITGGLVLTFFGCVLIACLFEYLKDNFADIWENIENWCDRYLSIGKD